MDGSLVTFLATHADLITSTLHPPTPRRQLQASEGRAKREENKNSGSHFLHRSSPPPSSSINTRNEKPHSSPSSLPSVPAKQGKGREKARGYQIFSRPCNPLHSTLSFGGRRKKKPSSFAPAAGTALSIHNRAEHALSSSGRPCGNLHWSAAAIFITRRSTDPSSATRTDTDSNGKKGRVE